MTGRHPIEPYGDPLFCLVGGRIRALRLQRGESQMVLGRAVGLGHATLSMYETGQREPGLHALISLAQHFEVPLSDLVSEQDL